MKKIITLLLIFSLLGCQYVPSSEGTSLSNRYFVKLFEEPFVEEKFCQSVSSGMSCSSPSILKMDDVMIKAIKDNKNVANIRPFWQLAVSPDSFTVEVNGVKREITGERSVSSVSVSYDIGQWKNIVLSQKEPETDYIQGYLVLSNTGDLDELARSDLSWRPDLKNNQYIYHLPLTGQVEGEATSVTKEITIEIVGIISDGYTGRGSIFINENDMSKVLEELSINPQDASSYIIDLKENDTNFLNEIDERLSIQLF